MLAGCATLPELDEVQQDFNQGEFKQVADHRIECKDDQAGCNKLHLIKGEACLQLATPPQSETGYLDCAVENLETGIALTRDWEQINIDPARPYGDLAEALRLRRDEATSGASAQADFKALKATAAGFAQTVPGHVGAVYWTQLVAFEEAKRLVGTSACPALADADARLQAALPRVQETSRYAQPYRALLAGLAAERRIRQCP
jgi:hypothetical protein